MRLRAGQAGTRREAGASIGPLRAQELLGSFGLRVAPALTAGAIVVSHTDRFGQGVLVAAAMVLTAWVLDPRPLASHLMPVSTFVLRILAPAAGIGLAALVFLPLSPLAWHAVPPALLGSLLVVALAALVVARFERRVEARIAVIGHPALARSLARELAVVGGSGYRVVGWVDTGLGSREQGPRRLGELADLRRIASEERIDLLVNAAGEEGAATSAEARRGASSLEVVEVAAHACLGQKVRLISLNQLHEELFGHVPLATMDAAFFQYLMHPRFRGGSAYAERAFDLMVGAVSALVLAPLVGAAALAIKLTDGGPVLYRQRRVGAGGREFRIVKLRTMRVDSERDGAVRWSSSDDERITRVGRVLRRTHLDEVSQLWNVLRGEMSLVGPRPERPEIVSALERQIPFYDRRELVKPGIAGWAQVRCGYAGSEEGTAWKLCHDLYYLKHRSVGFDLMIMLETLAAAAAFRDVQFNVRSPDERFVLDAVRPG